MSRATVELDFFGVDKGCSSMSPFPRCLPRQRSFRDIQSAISKINPELLKSVIVSAISHPLSPESTNHFNSNKPIPVPSSPKEAFSLVPRASTENSSETAPLTIFYNGTVAVYDVSQDKAETIMKLAEKGVSKGCETADEKKLPETINGDLPIARRKSLQRFVEKRNERYIIDFGVPFLEETMEIGDKRSDKTSLDIIVGILHGFGASLLLLVVLYFCSAYDLLLVLDNILKKNLAW